MPKQLVGSVYTTYSCGGAAQVAYHSLELAVERIRHIISSATGPTYIYWYIPDVDYVEHVRGASHAEVAQTLIRVERASEQLADGLDGHVRIVITADHGQIDIPDELRHVLTQGDPLLRHLIALPSCEPRVPAFHVRPDARTAFADEFRERFGATWVLLTIDEVEELRLFGPGPLSALTRERLGDFFAMNATHELIMAVPPRSREPLRGSHGGLLADEVVVPLIIV
jgi:predicted AlkP superfamily pyrophosphatase or phosphodiesterase